VDVKNCMGLLRLFLVKNCTTGVDAQQLVVTSFNDVLWGNKLLHANICHSVEVVQNSVTIKFVSKLIHSYHHS